LNLDYTFTVRQLQSGSEGLPIEIYVFTSSTDFIKYEDTQADIFDHILAVIPQFDLNIFQHPTGNDFKKALN
jgi:miniconductance mechanosensitive channel